MNDETEQQVLTIRDQLILSQALYTAIPVLEKEEHPEVSNISDMKHLLDEKFPIWKAVQAAKALTPAMHKELDSEEEESYRQWARDNYIPQSPINGTWHPVVQDECLIMNKDHSIMVPQTDDPA